MKAGKSHRASDVKPRRGYFHRRPTDDHEDPFYKVFNFTHKTAAVPSENTE